LTDSSWFHLSTGIGVGSTVAELQRSNPEAEFGRWSAREDPYLPASFGWYVLDGTTDRDWISDLQRALNDRGAEPAVDGEYGHRTRAAVAATQQTLGLDDRDGDIGPDTMTALGPTPPGNARIQSLVAGYRSC
jgi:peptidoglycan hydrolase-like protein with peptidoglycan-binding domain